MTKLVMESLFESAAEEFHVNSRFRSTLLNCLFQLSHCFFHNKLWNWDGRLSEETHLDSRKRIPAWANIEHPRQRSLTNSFPQKLVQYASLIFPLYHRPPQQKTITYHCFAFHNRLRYFHQRNSDCSFWMFWAHHYYWEASDSFH